jgi:hypothetical protein
MAPIGQTAGFSEGLADIELSASALREGFDLDIERCKRFLADLAGI